MTANAPTRHAAGDVGLAGDLAAIGPRPAGKVLAWADPRPCFYANSIGECGTCLGCKERIARAALTPSALSGDAGDGDGNVPLLSILFDRPSEPSPFTPAQWVGVMIDSPTEAGAEDGFFDIVEMAGSNLGENDWHFMSNEGCAWVLQPGGDDRFPYDLLVKMDPETFVRTKGRIVFAVRPKTLPSHQGAE